LGEGVKKVNWFESKFAMVKTLAVAREDIEINTHPPFPS